MILDELRAALTLADPGVSGCQRKQAWTEASPRGLSGNALLAAVGEKICVETPLGPLEVFLYQGDKLLQFRAGPARDWWVDDAIDVWSFVTNARPLSRAIVIVSEDHGEVSTREIQVPPTVDPVRHAAALTTGAQAEPPARISKRGLRAMVTCRYCPFRTRCNGFDKLHNATHDWSAEYHKVLGG